MVDMSLPNRGKPNPENTHPLWMFMAAISGLDDECERVRLTATGLSSLIPCRLSGVALLDETETTWNFVSQIDGHQLGSPQTEQICAGLESLFQAAIRNPSLVIATLDREAQDPSIPHAIGEFGIQTMAVAPIRTLHHRLGMVLVGRDNSEPFSAEERMFLSTIADHTAIGLENLRLHQALKKYSQHLHETVEERTHQLSQAEERHRVLLEINNAIISNLDRTSLFHAIAETLRNVLRFDRATLTLLDPARDVLQVQALVTTSARERFLKVGMEFPRQGSPLVPVYEKKQPFIRHHLEQGPLIGIEQNLFREGIRSYLAVPLIAKGVPFGTLNLGSCDAEEYSEEDAKFLMDVGQQVALAVENMLAYEEIAQLKRRLEQENLYLHEEIQAEQGFGDMVGRSPALREVLRQIDLVAPTDASVLILGESGTGKELVAREIHKRSDRQDKPLVRVNCASVPKELYESEFFGHTKGAFTGALKDRAGRFEIADGGTLFLDEVGEIPLELQSKLLRVLQEQQYERVGEERTRHVDVRIIAATNRDLRKAVEEGRFRQDLYYRLNVFPIEVAALRHRKEDIPSLATHLVELAAKKLNCTPHGLTQGHIMRLQDYDWPGNVRELQNVLERAVITSRGQGLQIDLPESESTAEPLSRMVSTGGLNQSGEVIPEAEMQRHERENILSALLQCDWQVGGPGGAAELLGIRPTTLHSRIKKMGIKRPD